MSTASSDNPNGYLTAVFGIKRDEAVAVAWSFAYFFCVLSSYYIIRPVREEMAVGSGPNTIPYLFIGTFVTMIFATSAFGWVASRFPRRVFLPWVYLFFISNMLIFWVVFSQLRGGGEDYVWLGRVFFVWVSVFNLFVVSVFWSFMADIYTRVQGRRLFGFISSGGSIGALAGGVVTSSLVTRIGFENLLLISSGVLLVAVFCVQQLKDWVHQEHENEIKGTVESENPLGGSALAGITHLFSSRYFLGIALMSIIASLLGTALYMFRAELIETAILSPDLRTQFFSNMNIAQNTLALIGQMFLVKQVVGRFGIGRSLVLFPAASVIGFMILAMDPTLMAVAVLDVVRRGLGFGFTKPSTDMLYSVVTPEEKYKTKNAIDTAIYRGGDVVGTWTIKLLSTIGIGMAAISMLMVPFAAVAAVVALWLGREYKRKAKLLRASGII
ncbi:MAG: MFS transporter [Gammaproteobacteria bacterium]|nr:MFS transporter [Gammaproteobacteria bacterium]NNF49115.1 MFS transporter [Woeseiaceae bacterium]NNL63822.1 MFS transporter [Woeseiaceae bacterium]